MFSSDYAAIREELASLGLSERVIFAGFVSDVELLHFYNAAEALVLASLDEGFGLTALEAMACGTPVVVSRAGAVPEVVGGAGRYFDPHKTVELASGLREVLADESLRIELRDRGIERARIFSWEHSARAALALFEQLSTKHG